MRDTHETIQHKITRNAPIGGIGFNDEGENVPVVGFDYPSEAGETYEDHGKPWESRAAREAMRRMLQIILGGNPDAKIIRLRAMALEYMLTQDGTQLMLAERMGVTKGRVTQMFSEIRSKLNFGDH